MFHSYSPKLLSTAERKREQAAWLQLSQLSGISLRTIWQYVSACDNSAAALVERWRKAPPNLKRGQLQWPDVSYLDYLQTTAADRQERILTPASAEYPRQLLDLPQPPAVLFVSGSSNINIANQISIVGSRRATPYGMSQAAILAGQLASNDITITSGLARGIDTQAHCGALKAHGHTIAVIGCGLDICYPRENAQLQKRIALEGNVISEYPYGYRPLSYNFPARNRLIAALSVGTIIVQASASSGALLTADIANSLGREVMVVPGALNVSQSEGCLQLLMDGASPIRHIRDVFDVLHIFADIPENQETITNISERSKAILASIPPDGLTIDELCQRNQLPPGYLAAVLNQLQLAGLVQRLPEAVWIRT